MAEARRRAHERFGVSSSTRSSSSARSAPGLETAGSAAAAAKPPRGGRRAHGIARARERAAALLRSRAPARARLELAKFAPSGRSLLVGLADPPRGARPLRSPRARPRPSRSDVAVEGARPGSRARCRSARAARREPARARPVDLERRAERVPTVAAVRFDRAFPHTLRIASSRRSRRRAPPGIRRLGSSRRRAGRRRARRGAHPGLPRIWLKRDVESGSATPCGGMQLRAVDAVAPLVARRSRSLSPPPSRRRGELKLVLRTGSSSGSATPRPAGEARGRAPGDPQLRRGRGLPRRERAGPPVAGENPQLSGRGRDFHLDGTMRFALTRPTRRRTLHAERNVVTPMLYSSFRSRDVETCSHERSLRQLPRGHQGRRRRRRRHERRQPHGRRGSRAASSSSPSTRTRRRC